MGRIALRKKLGLAASAAIVVGSGVRFFVGTGLAASFNVMSRVSAPSPLDLDEMLRQAALEERAAEVLITFGLAVLALLALRRGDSRRSLVASAVVAAGLALLLCPTVLVPDATATDWARVTPSIALALAGTGARLVLCGVFVFLLAAMPRPLDERTLALGGVALAQVITLPIALYVAMSVDTSVESGLLVTLASRVEPCGIAISLGAVVLAGSGALGGLAVSRDLFEPSEKAARAEEKTERTRRRPLRKARKKRKHAVSATGPAWSSLSDSADRLEPPGWSSSSCSSSSGRSRRP